MKKLFILIVIVLSVSSCIAQPVVNRAGAANTTADYRWMAKYNCFIPVYDDTTAANILKGIDSSFGIIGTRSPMAEWYRGFNPKRWIRLIDSENFDQFIDTAQGQSITNISIINQIDNSIDIAYCTAAGSCDTITYVTTINNATSVSFVTDSSIQICSVDTVSGGHVQICDTIITGKKGITYFFDNGVGLAGTNIVEHGINTLKHNTTLNTDYFKYNVFGNPVYDYTFNVKQGQSFPDGTGIASFWSVGNRVGGQPDVGNTVRFGVNYTGQNYPSLGTGYFGNSTIGYFLNVNGTGNGSYGLRADDPASKVGGIIFETLSSSTIGLSLFAAPAPGASTYWNMQPNTGEQYKAINIHTNQNIELLGKTYLNNARLEMDYGANIASANNLTLGTDGNSFLITGTTQINAITTANWQNGSVVYLKIQGALTIKHNTAGGAGTAPILLAGATDFVTTGGDVLALNYNGTAWDEVGRKASASGGGGTGTVTSVGLSMPSAFSVANSPVTSSGTLTITGAGTTSQFIDGTGALQTIGGYFSPNQTSAATTTHDQNYHEFYVNNQKYTQFTAGTGANQSFAAWDSTQTFFQTNKANFRTIIGTSRNLTSVGGSQVTTYNTSTNKGTALLAYPDSILVATSTTAETTLDYAKPMLKITRDSMLLKGLTQMYVGRFSTAKGTSTAAANDLTLPNDGNLFTITGNTQINAITTANWQASSEIGIIFTGTPTLKNNTAGGAGTATMLLAGRVDYTAAAGDYIAFRYDGTNWYETQRKLAASGGTYAFSNGITESPAGTVKLGGTLTGNTTLTGGAFGLILTGTSSTVSSLDISNNSIGAGSIVNITSTSTAATSNLQKGLNISLSGANATASQTTYGAYVLNSHSGSITANEGVYGEVQNDNTASSGVHGVANNGIGVFGTSSSYYGVYGVSNNSNGNGVRGSTTSGSGVFGIASTGIGVFASITSTGLPIQASANPSSTNTTVEMARYNRTTTGTAADGIGQFTSFYTETSDGTTQLANEIISKFVTATTATRTSQFIITGVNSGTTGDILTLNGNKSIKANGYGVKTFTGTAAYNLQVDASGNLIETEIGGGLVTQQSANYSVTATDLFLECTANSPTFTLPAGVTQRVYHFINTGAGTLTVATSSSQVIGNSGSATSTTVAAGASISCVFNGTQWRLF